MKEWLDRRGLWPTWWWDAKIAAYPGAFEARVKLFARDLGPKWIRIRQTAGLTLLFLSLECLCAEIARMSEWIQSFQRSM